MSYWSQMYARPQRAERLELPNGEARFESLMVKKLSEKDRSFAESLKRQFEDGGKLSPKQIECIDRMEQRYSPGVDRRFYIVGVFQYVVNLLNR